MSSPDNATLLKLSDHFFSPAQADNPKKIKGNFFNEGETTPFETMLFFLESVGQKTTSKYKKIANIFEHMFATSNYLGLPSANQQEKQSQKKQQAANYKNLRVDLQPDLRSILEEIKSLMSDPKHKNADYWGEFPLKDMDKLLQDLGLEPLKTWEKTLTKTHDVNHHIWL